MRINKILLGLAGLFLTILMGLIASTGSTFLVSLAIVVCACIFLPSYILISRQTIPYLILVTIFILYFSHSIFKTRLGLPIYTFLQFIILFIGFWGTKVLWKTFVQSKLLVVSALAFSCFILLAFISSFVTNNSSPQAAIFQFLSDLKFPMVLAFGLYMGKNVNVTSIIERATAIFIPIAMTFLILQWLVPNVYLSILNFPKLPVESSGIFPSPGLSIFGHPSILAAVSAILAIYYFSKWQVYGKKSRYDIISFFLLTFLLIGSNQRQEIFAFVLVIIGIYVLASRTMIMTRLAVSTIIFSIATIFFLYMFSEMLIREASSWGVDTFQAITHPRAQLYEGAVDIASIYFPFGSGLGTFGGVGSMKYDLALYYKLGFSNNWWWSDYEAYLLDTYWPNSLAESGYFGAIFLLLHYILFATYSIYKAVCTLVMSSRYIWLCVAGSFLWVLLVTPTSPGFQEILLLFFPGLFFGIAVANDKRS